MGPSQCPDDYTFGPIVQGCRDTFDFSLKFEKVFLAIIPACLLVVFSLARLVYLLRKPRIVRGLAFRIFKIASILVLAGLQVFLLPVLARSGHGPLYGLSIATSIANFASALVMAVLSSVEHSTCPRPSTILNSYLLLALLCDGIQIRTHWLMLNNPTQVIPFGVITASAAVKALCLVLENCSKVRWLKIDSEEHSPEEFSGIISLGFQSWLIPLLFNGYAKVLSIDNLYPLEKDMTAETAQAWEPNKSQEKKTKVTALAWSLIRHLRGLFLLPVVPRLAQIAFYYSQPVYTRVLLEHLGRPHDPSMAVVEHGLVTAGILIQLGTVLVMASYGYLVVRFKCKLRSCLSTALYRKLCQKKPGKGSAGNGDGAETVTLLSTDVERVCDGLILIHELWAVPVEIGVGLWILHRQLGSAFSVSIVVALVCSLASGWIARHARRHQHALMSAMQNRVTSTVGVIDNVTSLHLTGIAGSVPGLINSLRAVEIAASIRWNLFIVGTTLLGYVPLTITPVISLATTTSTLDVPTVFASLATMGILCYPLVIICRLLPLLQAALTCLGRIRDNLEAESRLDSRRIQGPSSSNAAISIDKGSFGWADGNMVLTGIDATIPARQISIVTGPVASGKSTLCKAILGEVPFSSGNVTLRTAYPGIGFCDQSPFLTNASIRNSIIGYARFDQKRFDEVVWATMLDEDISLFPDGYSTMAGPGGSILSGGQKQRLSLARALYLDSDILIVDDILNALDADTDAEVFSRVFGPNGIVRRRQATALLCSNSPHHLRWADHIIVLGDGGLVVSDGPPLEDEKASCPVTWSVAENTLMSKVQPRTHNSLSNEAEEVADASRLLTNWKAYRFYARKTGLMPILLILLGGLLFSCFQNMATYWTTQWTRDLLKRPRSFYLGIFALFQTLMLVAALGEGLVAEKTVARRSGLEFHKSAITALMAAPLSFFTSTDKGAIINLFSKDMRVVNEEIPGSAARASHKGIQVVGMAIIFCLGSPYLVVGYPILFCVVFAIQRIFLRTCRQLNLLDLELRGPLNTHFLDTINGMATIRAFGWVSDNVSHNNHLLNTSQRPAYLSAMLQQWLSLTLKMVAAFVAIAVIILSIHLSANAALTGASLATLTLFSVVLTGFVRSFTNLEVRMGSVNRLKTFFEDTPSQHRPNDFFPDKDWPRRGDVELKHVSASYVSIGEKTDTSPLAINDLTLAIRPGERVAICGRTGSGKSSVILLLLRLLDPLPSSSSSISIDDIPLDRIDSDTLRRGIIAVPQDPVFLPAGSTMKSNLDPFNDATDQECADALSAVHLSSLQAAIGDLHHELRAESLSAGQQRLFALARAVLRCRIRNRNLLKQCLPVGGILLLDEVSFAADENTERIIQEVVKVEFKDYTIIMVSHQLSLVVDFFERVIVMEEGKAVEMGSPAELMNKEGGRFAQLWNTSERKGKV